MDHRVMRRKWTVAVWDLFVCFAPFAGTTGVQAEAVQRERSLPAIVLTDTLISTKDYWDFNPYGIYVRTEGSRSTRTYFLVTRTGVCEELDFRAAKLRAHVAPVPEAERQMKKYAAMRVSSAASAGAGGVAFLAFSLVPRILLMHDSRAAYMRPRYAADAVAPCLFAAGIVLALAAKPALRRAVESYNAAQN